MLLAGHLAKIQGLKGEFLFHSVMDSPERLEGMAGLILAPPHQDLERAEALKVLADPEMKNKVAALGLDVVGGTPEQTREAIARDIPKWAKVIKTSGIQIQ